MTSDDSLSNLRDLTEKAKGLLSAHDHILEAIQLRNSVDMRPASANCEVIMETVTEIANELGDLVQRRKADSISPTST